MSAKPRLVLLLGILVLVALAALGWFFVLSPRLGEAEALQARALQVESANIALLGNYDDALNQARGVEAAVQDAKVIFARMPEEADIPTVITQVSEAATDAGIAPEDIQVISTSVPTPVEAPAASSDGSASADGTDQAAAPQAGADLATLQLDVIVKGTPEELLRFLRNIETIDRSLLIETTSMTVAPGSDPGESTLQVSGQMFVLQTPLKDLITTVRRAVEQAGIASG